MIVKKAQLRLDLPDLEKGAIFIGVNENSYYIYEDEETGKLHNYSKGVVEDNPKWFSIL